MGSNRDPRQEVTGELGAATSCPPSSGGAEQRRTPVMEQRAVLRPYLNLLDQVWHKRGYPEKLGATLHRYADDAILVCRKSAAQALQAFAAIATRMGLTINRDKTRITKLTEGFDFLGFHFVKRRSPTSGKYAIYIFPSKAAQGRVRRRIKTFTKRRAPIAPPDFVQQVNQGVRGWVHY